MNYENHEALPFDPGQWGAYIANALMVAPADLVNRTMDRMSGKDSIVPTEYESACNAVADYIAVRYGRRTERFLAHDSAIEGLEVAYSLADIAGVYGPIRMADKPLHDTLGQYQSHDRLVMAGWAMYKQETTVKHTVDACMAEIRPSEPYNHLTRIGIITGLAMTEHGERQKRAELADDVKVAEAEAILWLAYLGIRGREET